MTDDATQIIEILARDLKKAIDTIGLALQIVSASRSSGGTYFYDVPLTWNLGYFKGKKPLAVVLPGGKTVETTTWIQVARALLAECAASPKSMERLLDMRGKVFGRNRCILADTPKGMDVPIEFVDGFYFEAKFDTESLLRVIVERIFRPARFDPKGIEIRIKLDGLKSAKESEVQHEQLSEQ